MPLTKENRHLLEVAIVSYLKMTKEATSKDIYNYLKKRGILAVRGVRQVSIICSGFERKGVLLSRLADIDGKFRTGVKKAWRAKIWRQNPNFYREHPRQSMFTFRFNSPAETSQIRKRRMKATR